ncbi:hypothetical protein Tco_0345800 [Tanacetum coccineum]
MPHYHAMEATKAIKPILGEYYQFDGTSVFKAMYRETKECIYVDKDEEVKEVGHGLFSLMITLYSTLVSVGLLL